MATVARRDRVPRKPFEHFDAYPKATRREDRRLSLTGGSLPTIFLERLIPRIDLLRLRRMNIHEASPKKRAYHTGEQKANMILCPGGKAVRRFVHR
jgi:hypothetical protein